MRIAMASMPVVVSCVVVVSRSGRLKAWSLEENESARKKFKATV